MEPGEVTKRLKEDGYIARQSKSSQSLYVNLGGPRSEINRNDFKGLIVINEGTIFGTQQVSEILEFRNLLMQEKEGKWVPRKNVPPSPQGKDGCVSVNISQDEQFIFCKIGEDLIRLYGKKQQIDFNKEQYDWGDIEGFIETISDMRIGSQHEGLLRAEEADLPLPNESGDYRPYWTALGDFLVQRDSFLRPPAPRKENWVGFSVGRDITLYAIVTKRTKMYRVDLVIQRGDAKDLLHGLMLERHEIEAEIGEALSWEERDSEIATHVILRHPFDFDNYQDRNVQFQWFAETLEKFYRAFKPRLTGERLRELGESKASEDFAQNVEACTLDLDESGEFDPAGIEDARGRVVRAVATRRGQPAFRKSLLRAYGGRCCISGCAVQEVLEAAHIVPYQGDATDHFQNGLLLRSDLHTLFDWQLLTIEPKNHTVLLDASLRDSEYWKFAGQQIRLPEIPEQHPSPKALAQHGVRVVPYCTTD